MAFSKHPFTRSFRTNVRNLNRSSGEVFSSYLVEMTAWRKELNKHFCHCERSEAISSLTNGLFPSNRIHPVISNDSEKSEPVWSKTLSLRAQRSNLVKTQTSVFTLVEKDMNGQKVIWGCVIIRSSDVNGFMVFC
ncbi:MAG TPA: hypothetical protein VHA56_06735 [Mucilaginibacter sp.]|nr:hypothetical protein [Mucilaginibacter sp.]